MTQERVRGILQASDETVQVKRLPARFEKFGNEPLQLRSGHPNKIGIMELEWERDAEGITRMTRNYGAGQQIVRRALYLEDQPAGFATGFIQSISSGILQGDRYGVDVKVHPGAQALLTTQSAPKVYRMEYNYATQRINMNIESGAYFEYIPDVLIPYDHGRFYQEIDLTVADDATLMFSDAVSPGREARGESFEYDLIVTRVQAKNQEGRLRFADTVVLEPKGLGVKRDGLLGSRNHYASFYVLTRKVDVEQLTLQLHEAVQGSARLDGGASQLPGADGVVVRVVGDEWRYVETALYRAWKVARRAVLGVDVPTIATTKYGREPAVEWETAEASAETV